MIWPDWRERPDMCPEARGDHEAAKVSDGLGRTRHNSPSYTKISPVSRIIEGVKINMSMRRTVSGVGLVNN